MAASRTPAATVPLELKRQGERVSEQLAKLQVILDNSSTYLGEMAQILDGYGDDIVTEINNLRDAIDTYKTKSSNIYGAVSTNLITYANNLIGNLDELRSSISTISEAVESL